MQIGCTTWEKLAATIKLVDTDTKARTKAAQIVQKRKQDEVKRAKMQAMLAKRTKHVLPSVLTSKSNLI